MKIYLWAINEGWKLFDNPSAKELADRNITIGDEAKIGDGAKIGDEATILKTPATFTELNILLKVGIPMSSGEGVFYKAIKPNLTDFYGGNYQYRIGKGDHDLKLKRDQNVECGAGWHFTSYWGAVSFLGGKQGIIISATIKLKDILAVHQKIRVKAFSNIQIVKIKGMANVLTKYE